MIGSEARVRSQSEDVGGVTPATDSGSARVVNLRHWAIGLAVADAVAAGTGVATLLLARFGVGLAPADASYYRELAVVLVPAWLITLSLSGSYDARSMAAGMEQYRRVVNGAAWLLALVTFTAFAASAHISRGVVIVSVPYVAALTIAERFAARKLLHRRFAADQSAHRVLAVGSPTEVADLVAYMRRASYSGFRVVAALTPGHAVEAPLLPNGIPWAGGSLHSISETAGRFSADTLALVGIHVLERGGLRRLSWELESTDIALVVAPAMTDIAGPRIRIRPVEGLPLLHIDRPQFSGIQRTIKAVIDRSSASILCLLLSPVLVGCWLGVRLTSSGPALYRQVRLGLDGRHFSVLKFRSMRVGADACRDDIAGGNEVDGALFKIRRDSRITSFGRFMRRWSLDELPQLFNVASGSMSLVGPRPLPVGDIEHFDGDARRRSLVKPGMTGLWQVSGRSELSWEESLRLDLHYVDHWSIGLDLLLLWRTILTVMHGRGAY